MSKANEKILDKIYKEHNDLVSAIKPLYENLEEEENHGAGFATKQLREEYILFVSKSLNIIKEKFDNSMKTLLDCGETNLNS